jgi:putative mRNA 3-end processing factor
MSCVFASGWQALQQANTHTLLLSDHMDWLDLLAYIEQVQPTEIWTIHGDGAFLKEHYSNSIVKVKNLAH